MVNVKMVAAAYAAANIWGGNAGTCHGGSRTSLDPTSLLCSRASTLVSSASTSASATANTPTNLTQTESESDTKTSSIYDPGSSSSYPSVWSQSTFPSSTVSVSVILSNTESASATLSSVSSPANPTQSVTSSQTASASASSVSSQVDPGNQSQTTTVTSASGQGNPTDQSSSSSQTTPNYARSSTSQAGSQSASSSQTTSAISSGQNGYSSAETASKLTSSSATNSTPSNPTSSPSISITASSDSTTSQLSSTPTNPTSSSSSTPGNPTTTSSSTTPVNPTTTSGSVSPVNPTSSLSSSSTSASPSQSCPPAPNLVDNPSMEDTTPDQYGWYDEDGGEADQETNEKPAHSGTVRMDLVLAHGGDYAHSSFHKILKEPLEAGKAYTFSFYWAPVNTDASSFCVFFYSLGNNDVGAVVSTDRPDLGQYQFAELQSTLGPNTANLDRINVEIVCEKPGDYDDSNPWEILLDDFSITKDCVQPTPATGTSSSPSSSISSTSLSTSGNPTTSTTAKTPENSTTPGNPTTSTSSTTPRNPTSPTNPTTSPTNPTTTSHSTTPTNPVSPSNPTTPTNPISPSNPTTTPRNPTTPSNPTTTPKNPTTPSNPTTSSAPSSSTTSTTTTTTPDACVKTQYMDDLSLETAAADPSLASDGSPFLWTNTNQNYPYVEQNGNPASDQPHARTGSAYLLLDNYNSDHRYLTKDLEPGVNYEFSFWYAGNLAYDTDACTFYILVGSSFVYTLGLGPYFTPFQYQQATIPVAVTTESIQVVIMLQCLNFALEGTDFHMLLDDFSLTDDIVPVGCEGGGS